MRNGPAITPYSAAGDGKARAPRRKATSQAPVRKAPAPAAEAGPPAQPPPATGAAPVAAPDEMAALQAAFTKALEAADIDKAERIEALMAKVRDARSERAYTSAMSAAQGEIQVVARTAENEERGNSYAPLEAIVEAITPIWKKHGFGLSFETRNVENGFLHVIAIVGHADGCTRSYEYDVPVETGLTADGDVRMTAPQTYGTTTTFARRYATCMIFNVVTKRAPELRDRDGETKPAGEKVTPAQVAAIEAALRTKDMPPKRFCQYFKIRSVSDLPASKVDAALTAIAAAEATEP